MDANDLMVGIDSFPLVLIDTRQKTRTEAMEIYLPNEAQCKRFYDMVKDFMWAVWRIKFIAVIDIYPPGAKSQEWCLKIKYNEAQSPRMKEAVRTIAAIRALAR